MSWFKRSGATAVGPYHRNNAGGLSSSSSAHHIRAAADSGLLLHAVHSLWNSVESVLNKQDGKPSENETAAVLSFVTEVANSLECHNTTAHTQLTDFLLMVDAMNKLLLWTLRFSATIDTESADRLALLQLRVFDLLLNHSERCLLTEKRLIWPLLRLLVACGPSKNCSIEDQLALVLHQLCVGVSQYPASLELLFDTVTAEGSRSEGTAADNNSKFLVFSLLVPYVHREGLIAQQARDDLLLIMSMSSSLDVIGQHIVDKSDFCPLLATGLSGLYSSLPRRIEYPSDDWNQITPEDIAACPPLGRFMNSLEFCNAVIQVAHPYVCENLKKYVYDGFLVSVLGPALHQTGIVFIRWDTSDSTEEDLTQQSVGSNALSSSKLLGLQSAAGFHSRNTLTTYACPQTLFALRALKHHGLPTKALHTIFPATVICKKMCSKHVWFHEKSSMEEVTAATAYLELFIRKTSEPGLLRTFIDFVLNSQFDNVSIIDSLITRVFSIPRLCMVTLTLFKTLVDLNFEDVMFHLIFKYLVPCTHVMVSQQKSFRDSDAYCKVAEKLISLMPLSSHAKVSSSLLLNDVDESQSDSSTSSLVSSETVTIGAQSPRVATTVLSPFQRTGAKLLSTLRRKARQSPTGDDISLNGSANSSGDSSVRDMSTPPSTPVRSSQGQLESNYMEYLLGARMMIHECVRATAKWSAQYDGENPLPASRSLPPSEKNTLASYSHHSKMLASTENSVEIGSSVEARDSNNSVTDVEQFQCVVAPSIANEVVRSSSFPTLNDTRVDVGSDLSVGWRDSETVKNVASINIPDEVHHPPAVEADMKLSCVETKGEPDQPSAVEADMKLSCVETKGEPEQPSAVEADMKLPSVEMNGELSTAKNEAELLGLVDSVSGGKAADSLDLFLRQLSYVSAKLDDTSIDDDFTEFEALIDNLTKHVSKSRSVDQPSSFSGGNNGESFEIVGSTNSSVIEHSSSMRTSEVAAVDQLSVNVENVAQQITSDALSPVHSNSAVCDDEKELSTKKSFIKSSNVNSSCEMPFSNNSVSPLHLSSPTYDASPSIGPFLTSLLGKLELMVQNPLYVNLQLTGLLARLACFPQPLLKSLLLSHTLVFQPSIKSLLQVLTTVKHRLDHCILTVPDYDGLLVQASQYLHWRDEVGRQDGDTSHFTPGRHPIAMLQGDKRKSSTTLSDFWRRASLRGSEQLQPLTLDQRGAHFVNRQGSPLGDSQVSEPLEVRTKNAIYCAIVLKEFVKELAAISQEHVLIQAYCGNT